MSLAGRVVIVTGAGSGIGRETAILLSQNGGRVVLVGRRREPLEGTLSKLEEKRGFIVQADVSNVKDAQRLVDETLREFGRLDILVNNAGVEAPYKSVTDLSEEEWDHVLDTNLKGVFLCSKFATPAMRNKGGGVITNVSSNWGIVAGPNASAYCESKAA